MKLSETRNVRGFRRTQCIQFSPKNNYVPAFASSIKIRHVARINAETSKRRRDFCISLVRMALLVLWKRNTTKIISRFSKACSAKKLSAAFRAPSAEICQPNNKEESATASHRDARRARVTHTHRAASLAQNGFGALGWASPGCAEASERSNCATLHGGSRRAAVVIAAADDPACSGAVAAMLHPRRARSRCGGLLHKTRLRGSPCAHVRHHTFWRIYTRWPIG